MSFNLQLLPVLMRGKSGAQPPSGVINNYVPMVAPFYGNSRTNITDITINSIVVHDTSDVAPKVLALSASDVVATGTRTTSSNPIVPSQDLEFSWTVTWADGSPVEDLEDLTLPNTAVSFNPYTGQISLNATMILREPGEYKATLEARGQHAGNTALIKSSSINVTVTQSDDIRTYYDNENGDNANDGLDPHGFALSSGTYTDSTRELTQVAAFTSYAHDVSIPYTFRDNWIYLSGNGITDGLYEIEGKVNNDTIILRENLGSNATGISSSNGAKQSGQTDGYNCYKGGQAHTLASSIEIGFAGNNHVVGYGSLPATLYNSGGENFVISTKVNLSGAQSVGDVGYVGNIIADAEGIEDRSGIGGINGSSNAGLKTLLIDSSDSINNASINGLDIQNYGNGSYHINIYNSYIDSLRNYSENQIITTASGSTVVVSENIPAITHSTGRLVFSDNGEEVEYLSFSGSTYTLKHALSTTHTGTVKSFEKNKRQGIFAQTNENGIIRIFGCTIDADCDHSILDHYIYPGGSNDYCHYAYNHFRNGDGANFAINLNVVSGVTPDYNYSCINDNYVSNNANYGFDCSNNANDAGLNGFYNTVFLRNRGNPTDAMFFQYNNYSASYIANEYWGEGLFFNQGTSGSHNPDDYVAVLSKNKIYTSNKAIKSNAGNSVELNDNEIWVTGSNAPVEYSSAALATRDFAATGNVFYAPNANNNLADDGGTAQDLDAFNIARNGVNTYQQLDWNVPENGDFSPYIPAAPTLVETLEFPEVTDGQAYFYDASVIFAGRDITSYNIETGTLGSGITFNTTTGVFSGTASGTTNLTGLSISATNPIGTSSASNTDTLVINSSVPLEFSTNGIDSFLSHASISLTDAGDTLSLMLHRIGDPSSTNLWLVDGDAGGGTEANVSIAPNGKMTYESDACSATINGDPVVNFTTDLSSYFTDVFNEIVFTHNGVGPAMAIQRYGAAHNDAAEHVMRIKKISIQKGGLTTAWNVDSGSITTEAPVIDELGIGALTFNNVNIEDWS